MQKDHKRSDLIAKLNKELAEQDLCIEALRKAVNNNELADKVSKLIIGYIESFEQRPS